MIQNHDRSGWFGASDTATVMGKWTSKTFEKWWMVKLGLRQDNFSTMAMETGTALEGRILDHLNIAVRDRQILKPRLLLRVNLDGESHTIHEVKTHGREIFTVTRPYWMQAQVEMYAAGMPLEIVAYRLEPADYMDWFRPIEDCRISHHPVAYNEQWVVEQYLPRLAVLAAALRDGRWPK